MKSPPLTTQPSKPALLRMASKRERRNLWALHGLYAKKVGRDFLVGGRVNMYDVYEVRQQGTGKFLFEMSLNATVEQWAAAIERWTLRGEWIE